MPKDYNQRTEPVRLYAVDRLNCSVNGNPRFDLHTSAGTFTTQSDASCSYDIENVARMIPAGGAGLPVTLKTTRAGRVWDIATEGYPS